MTIKVEWIEWDVMSTSTTAQSYTIGVCPELNQVKCNCKSGQIRGYCKHIKFYKKLIRRLMKCSQDI